MAVKISEKFEKIRPLSSIEALLIFPKNHI